MEGECSICCDKLVPEREGDGGGASDGEASEGEGESSNEGSSGGAEGMVDPGEWEREGLVWCELQCGKNYHKGCIRSLLAVAEELGTRRRCPDCRTEWVGT